ncbi:universal stress protein [Allohahella marinimesophila]|uniref:Universal stress protein n=1 Tax=Allohahella marinimesophila TaxID=1054972 RepID=A0ABP7PI22_9GAMM
MNRFNNIVYVSDRSLNQTATMARTVALAQASQARLTVLEVVPDIPAGVWISLDGIQAADLTAALVQERQLQIELLTSGFKDEIEIEIEVLVGRLSLEAIRAVLRKDFDLLIKPAENPDYLDRLFGSDDMHLLRKCPCPVWLMKPLEGTSYRSIVAALDLGADDRYPAEKALNRQILELAAFLAVSESAELHLLHAWDAPEAEFIRIWANDPDTAETDFVEGEHFRRQNDMESQALELRDWLGAEAYDYLSPRIHLARGNPKKAIPRLAENLKADLVVMGTIARTGIPGFIIGNTAEAILDQLKCSVLTLKPPGFRTPVTLD